MKRGYLLVEGHGEVAAAQNLIVRLAMYLAVYHPWGSAQRWPNLHLWEAKGRGGVRRGADYVRTRPDAGALLILRDEEDACPRELAPQMAWQLSELALPFPAAYVLLRPEYEVLFLPCLHRLDAIGFPPGLRWDGEHWESRRGIKEWLSRQLPPGRTYKPTVQQLEITRRLDFDALATAGVPSFGSLQRALRFLDENWERPGRIYP